MMIQSNGLVSACFLDWNKSLIMGDSNTEYLNDIWLGEKFNSFRKMMLEEKRKEHSFCSKCGQLRYGMADDIDTYAKELREKFA